ncbi:hypothetical protein [Micromonospora maris]|uniref:hypothetical protein n=1 Tax=Micromonospora maris TaxID=1003110 RepID=UPI002E0E53D6|nr:hypothetical protein OG712_04690 [Micromonospora maris]
MSELPPEASPGLRAAQRALDRDLRLALENARANNGSERGPADNTPALSEKQIKDARDVAASLVNGHLKDGPLGWPRVAVHRFLRMLRLLRMLRYFGISESAPKPRPAAAAEHAGAGEQAGAGQQDRQASGERAPGSDPSEPTRESQQAAANQPGDEAQSSQPSGDDESPPAPSESAPEPREPITEAQVESWKATLNEEGEHLLKHEKERLERAIAVAYLISNDPHLQKLYEDPGQMQDVANMVALADWVADRYDMGPRADEEHKATRGASASARTAPVHTYGDDQPVARTPETPALTYADDGLAVSPPGTPALTYADDGLAVSPPGTPARTSAAGQHVAARDARPERVPPGNPRAASLTSLHSPKRPAGSPPPRPAAPDSSRPDHTAGQGRGRR